MTAATAETRWARSREVQTAASARNGVVTASTPSSFGCDAWHPRRGIAWRPSCWAPESYVVVSGGCPTDIGEPDAPPAKSALPYADEFWEGLHAQDHSGAVRTRGISSRSRPRLLALGTGSGEEDPARREHHDSPQRPGAEAQHGDRGARVQPRERDQRDQDGLQ